jgi:L-seryl-tRNA(Ser) seleniumtransferase
VPVIGRIADDSLRLDLRCLAAAEETEFASQLARLGSPHDRPHMTVGI